MLGAGYAVLLPPLAAVSLTWGLYWGSYRDIGRVIQCRHCSVQGLGSSGLDKDIGPLRMEEKMEPTSLCGVLVLLERFFCVKSELDSSECLVKSFSCAGDLQDVQVVATSRTLFEIHSRSLRTTSIKKHNCVIVYPAHRHIQRVGQTDDESQTESQKKATAQIENTMEATI